MTKSWQLPLIEFKHLAFICVGVLLGNWKQRRNIDFQEVLRDVVELVELDCAANIAVTAVQLTELETELSGNWRSLSPQVVIVMTDDEVVDVDIHIYATEK
jgi:hypothetical protein